LERIGFFEMMEDQRQEEEEEAHNGLESPEPTQVESV